VLLYVGSLPGSDAAALPSDPTPTVSSSPTRLMTAGVNVASETAAAQRLRCAGAVTAGTVRELSEYAASRVSMSSSAAAVIGVLVSGASRQSFGAHLLCSLRYWGVRLIRSSSIVSRER
jgi:hypothetical protein